MEYGYLDIRLQSVSFDSEDSVIRRTFQRTGKQHRLPLEC